MASRPAPVGHVGSNARSPAITKAQRSLALACREAASDEQVAEWLIAIAAGRDPWAKVAGNGAPVFSSPPDWTHRIAALKMFLERRDGAPMQSIQLRAEIDAVTRGELGGRDVIDVESLEANAQDVLRTALRRALKSADAPSPDELASADDALGEPEKVG